MSEFRTPEDMWDFAWQMIARGRADRKHPARTPTLATIGPDGPQMRTLVLRAVDRAAAELEFHADRDSAKIEEITPDPRVALHVWLPKQDLQIRLRGDARLIQADPDRWAQIPEPARTQYGSHPAPGTPMDEPEDHVADAALERFTAIRVAVADGDILHLGEDRHRRIRARRMRHGWDVTWVAP